LVLCILNKSLYNQIGSKLSKIPEITQLIITVSQYIVIKDGINKHIIPKIILINSTIVYIKSLIVIKSSDLIIIKDNIPKTNIQIIM
jgi:hypothetical protein